MLHMTSRGADTRPDVLAPLPARLVGGTANSHSSEVHQLETAFLKHANFIGRLEMLEKGRFDLVRLGGMTIGRATYEPGWKWSEHVGPSVGATRCHVEHVGLVLSGRATAAFDDGTVFELRAGELFYIPPIPHDSWVVGDQPYVSLHFLGADQYATPNT